MAHPGQANDIGEAHIKAWRDFAQQRPKKKKKGATGRVARLPFCEQLIKATTCNLLMPPCDGDGSQRYRKPCKAFSLALQYGCNWTLPVGDLSFAEPPDCFELPIRAYMQAEYLDAGEIGADAETDTSSRADDVVTIAKLLEEEGHTEHAAFMYLQALRFRSDDKFAHLRTFAVVHGLQEYVKSLKSQLALAQSLLPATNKCNAMLEELNSKEIAAHKGPGPGAKIKYILQYKHMKGSQMFYETGVWYGETINGLKAHFARLVSIEISEQIAELARQRFKDDLNVEILTGDSAALLPSVLQTRDRAIPAIFWLDGHFSGSRFETAKADMDTPILTELDLVLAQVHVPAPLLRPPFFVVCISAPSSILVRTGSSLSRIVTHKQSSHSDATIWAFNLTRRYHAHVHTHATAHAPNHTPTHTYRYKRMTWS